MCSYIKNGSYAPIIGIGGVIKVMSTGAGMEWVIALAVLVIIGFVPFTYGSCNA